MIRSPGLLLQLRLGKGAAAKMHGDGDQPGSETHGSPGVLQQHGVHPRTLIFESGSKGRRALWDVGSIQKLQAPQLWLHMTFVLRLL